MTISHMLDSNVCIAAMRATDGALFKRLQDNKSKLSISTIVLHELLHGANRSARADHQIGRVMALISLLKVIEFDANAATHSGNIHASLAKSGQIIGAYDMLIAGHARSLGLIVVTSNLREFGRVEGLRCEDWLA